MSLFSGHLGLGPCLRASRRVNVGKSVISRPTGLNLRNQAIMLETWTHGPGPLPYEPVLDYVLLTVLEDR